MAQLKDSDMLFSSSSRVMRVAAALFFCGMMVGAPALADDAGKPVGDQLYAASFKDLKDQTASLGQFKGKVLVMYFWATWCVPCRVETPNLVKLDATFKAQHKDVAVVGIALDSGDKVRTFVKDNNVTYPIFTGMQDAVKLGKALGNEAGAIPFMVVVDKNGKLVRSIRGELPNDELEKIIDPLVG